MTVLMFQEENQSSGKLSFRRDATFTREAKEIGFRLERDLVLY